MTYIVLTIITLILLLFALLFIPIKYEIVFENIENVILSIRYKYLFIKGNYYLIDGKSTKEFKVMSKEFVEKDEELLKDQEEKVKEIKKETEKIKETEHDEANNLEEKINLAEHQEKKGYVTEGFKEKLQFVKNITKLAKKTVFKIFPKRVNILGRVGFENPADTGYIIGCIYAIRPFVRKHKIEIEPVFEEEVYEIKLYSEGKVIIAPILVDLVKFYFNKENNKMIKNIIKGRR
jgi:predicted nuclease with TOPRIM domain